MKEIDVLSVAASRVAAVRGSIWDFRMIRMGGNCCSRILQFFFASMRNKWGYGFVVTPKDTMYVFF